MSPTTLGSRRGSNFWQLPAFLDDGYEVALAEQDDPIAERLNELLAAEGRRIRTD